LKKSAKQGKNIQKDESVKSQIIYTSCGKLSAFMLAGVKSLAAG